MELSIVIPAFNESHKIVTDIKAAEHFLINNTIQGEILVVDDGSTDKTSEVAEKVGVSPKVTIKIISNEEHRGKGYAVRTGILKSRGEIVMFADSGNCVPYECALTGLQWLKEQSCDIAHGSRKLQESNITRPWVWYRKIYSMLFRRILIIYMKLPSTFTDTQCGFKLYEGIIARQLYENCNSDGFMFDVEIILRALDSGLHIKEFPVQWTADPDSRLSLKKNIISIFVELISIKKMADRGFS